MSFVLHFRSISASKGCSCCPADDLLETKNLDYFLLQLVSKSENQLMVLNKLPFLSCIIEM